ncbi:MAG: Gfo/Idh/MocA family protein [Bacteroidota bacterium]
MSMALRKLKVGIIGAGMAFERLHYPAFQRLADRYEIAALCDVDIRKAQDWAGRLGIGHEHAYSRYEDMLQREDLDVVDIMVPIELNYAVTESVARALAEKNGWNNAGRRTAKAGDTGKTGTEAGNNKGNAGSGKGIITEKPLASSMDEAYRARDLAREYGIPIMVAENYRYNQEINVIRDLVRTRRVGNAVYFIQNVATEFPVKMYGNDFYAREWRQHPRFPGGNLTDAGLHDIAALRHIFGPIARLHAFGVPQDDDFSPYAVVNVNLRFKSGVTGQFSFYPAGREIQRPLIGLRIFGEEGMIYLEERLAGTINVFHNDGRQERIPYTPYEGYYNELLNMYNALTGTEPVSVPPEMEFGDLKTIMDILKSIEEGSVVPVDQAGTYAPVYAHQPHRPHE